MACPINDVRNFKATKANSNTDNVVGIRGTAPVASLHFARADEADVEVTIESIREDNIMTTENVVETAAEQIETVEITSVKDRMAKMRKSELVNVAIAGVAIMASSIGTAAAAERSIKGAAIIGGALVAGNVASVYRKNNHWRSFRAKFNSEETYQDSIKPSVGNITAIAATGAVVGAFIGRFLTKKNS